ncbi:MAG: DUF1287 domain-containing protein [Pseudomonadota bacterium]|jgi:uncharacterized protein YijF (DUF1287 family)
MMNRRSFVAGGAGLAALLCAAPGLAGVSRDPAARLVAAAEGQIGVTTIYDGAYRRIAYPGGDVAPERGVCTDVVIRAYRTGLGIDLQRLVHEDMASHFSIYPKNWGLARPDPHIDHRRVPNLQTFLKRQGALLPPEEALRPGDLITQMIGGRLPHIAVMSDRRVRGADRLMAIHNIGAGAEYADLLPRFPVTGRYRYLPEA